ncbi:MAG: hypothetical protein DDG60_15310 [Anaerolineae bacterium]|nr:MAG: hypothetical protein DDG60_15310 [Anaerolineae bacterium]
MLPELHPLDERDLTPKLRDEVFKALGWGTGHPLRAPLTPLFTAACRRFARLAVRFDRNVAKHGFRKAARRLLPHFVREVHVGGAEQVPAEGPLLVVSNHPGTIDGLAIAGYLHRPDLKIVVSGVPFIRHLRATANHLIYSSLDTVERMMVVRSAIRHLEEGGAVLLFPSGGIDPDPAVMPGALESVETWSPSLEVILRRVPSARVLITFVSGVLHPAWAHSPVTHLRRGRRNQQRVAEFFQVIQQMLFPGRLLVSPSVCFARPLQFAPRRETPILPALIAAAREHFETSQGELQ